MSRSLPSRADIAIGRLVDLSMTLPSIPMTLTAARLSETVSPIMGDVWDRIQVQSCARSGV